MVTEFTQIVVKLLKNQWPAIIWNADVVKVLSLLLSLILSDVKYTGNEHENCHNHHPDFNKYCLHKNISDTELNDVIFNELFV